MMQNERVICIRSWNLDNSVDLSNNDTSYENNRKIIYALNEFFLFFFCSKPLVYYKRIVQSSSFEQCLNIIDTGY